MKTINYLTITILYSTLIILVVFSNVPYSELSIQGQLKKYIQTVLPQGWEFFTLNPRSEYTVIYKYNSNGEIIIQDFKNSSTNSYLGISKINRIRNIELEVLISRTDSSKYITCFSFEELKNISDTTTCYTIKNTTNIHAMKGTFLIRKTTPIPWAWYCNNPNLFIASKIIKIKIDEVY